MDSLPFDEKVIGGLAAAAAAVFAGWRIAKRLRVNVRTGNGAGENGEDEGHKRRTEILASIDGSLKALVIGQQDAFKKLDKIQEAAEAVRREIAEVKGSLGRLG